jgi:Protein of unknown function (DUF1566)
MNRFTRHTLIPLALACAALTLLLGAEARANAPVGRYTVSGAGASAIVLDTKTKLTWQQTPASTPMAWADAQTYCAGVGSTLDGTGWRLPTVKELLTLVDYARVAPAIDPTAFPDTPNTFFWSATLASSVTQAWDVVFGDGSTSINNTATTNDVRCVR